MDLRPTHHNAAFAAESELKLSRWTRPSQYGVDLLAAETKQKKWIMPATMGKQQQQ